MPTEHSWWPVQADTDVWREKLAILDAIIDARGRASVLQVSQVWRKKTGKGMNLHQMFLAIMVQEPYRSTYRIQKGTGWITKRG